MSTREEALDTPTPAKRHAQRVEVKEPTPRRGVDVVRELRVSTANEDRARRLAELGPEARPRRPLLSSSEGSRSVAEFVPFLGREGLERSRLARTRSAGDAVSLILDPIFRTLDPEVQRELLAILSAFDHETRENVARLARSRAFRDAGIAVQRWLIEELSRAPESALWADRLIAIASSARAIELRPGS